jgi:hypothetical protein
VRSFITMNDRMIVSAVIYYNEISNDHMIVSAVIYYDE